jgi:hypothetical protein
MDIVHNKSPEQSIVLNHGNYISYAVDATVLDGADLMFVIDNINEHSKLTELLQKHSITDGNPLTAEEKFEMNLNLNSPLDNHHAFHFKANIKTGNSLNRSTVFIYFCNKLFGGDVKRGIIDTMNLVLGSETSRLVVHDSRREPNEDELKDAISSYFKKISDYKIDVQIFVA